MHAALSTSYHLPPPLFIFASVVGISLKNDSFKPLPPRFGRLCLYIIRIYFYVSQIPINVRVTGFKLDATIGRKHTLTKTTARRSGGGGLAVCGADDTYSYYRRPVNAAVMRADRPVDDNKKTVKRTLGRRGKEGKR